MRKLVILLIAGVMALIPLAAYAQEPGQPDTIEINDARAFRDLLEPGDMQVILRYTLEYATPPNDSADAFFWFRLEHDGSDIAFSAPAPFPPFNGYVMGAGGFYLTASETAALGLTAGGEWADWPVSNLTAHFEGNPFVFATPSSDSWALSTGGFFGIGSHFSTGIGTETNQRQLAARVITMAAALSTAWGEAFLTTANLLNDTLGAPYFTASIPGLRQMAPTAFASHTLAPVIPTPAVGTGNFAETAGDRFDGNILVGVPLAALAVDLSTPVKVVSGIAVMVLWAFGTFQLGRQFGARGVQVGLIIGVMAVLPLSAWGGLMDWTPVILLLAFLVIGSILKMVRDNLK